MLEKVSVGIANEYLVHVRVLFYDVSVDISFYGTATDIATAFNASRDKSRLSSPPVCESLAVRAYSTILYICSNLATGTYIHPCIHLWAYVY